MTPHFYNTFSPSKQQILLYQEGVEGVGCENVPSGLFQQLLSESVCWRELKDTGLQNYLKYF